MIRDDARKLWADSGILCSDLTKDDFFKLHANLSQAFEGHSDGHDGRVKYEMLPLSDRDADYENWRHISYRCKSCYFDNREAVTFNPDGFIGFAGWADDRNIIPFINAFTSWVAEIKQKRAFRDETADTDIPVVSFDADVLHGGDHEDETTIPLLDPVNCKVCNGGPNGHTLDCPALGVHNPLELDAVKEEAGQLERDDTFYLSRR